MPVGNTLGRGVLAQIRLGDGLATQVRPLTNAMGLSYTISSLLYGGSTITGQVQVTSTLTGNVFQVICTVLQDIPLSPSL